VTGAVTVTPGPLRPVRLVPPPSKSDAQRALVLSHVLDQPALRAFAEDGEPRPTDVQVMAAGLSALRRAASTGEAVEVDCRDGGAPFRLLLGQAAVTPGARVCFTGTPRLGERPHGALVQALRDALGPSGLHLEQGNPWPLSVLGAAQAAPVPVLRVDARGSSQFPSSLLLAAAALVLRERRPWTVSLAGGLASAGYLELTVHWLRRCGFLVSKGEGRWTVEGHAPPAAWPAVPGDWSSLGYLLLLAWRSGGRAARVDLQAPHPDRAVVRVLRGLGLRVEVDPQGEATVQGRATSGLDADGAECPDLLPTLGALACVLPGPSTLRHVSILRAKESDRLEALSDLVRAAGGTPVLEGDTLHVVPPEAVRPFAFDARGDHRMAMSAATLAVLGGVEVELRAAHGVDKSFPGFFAQLAGLGCAMRGP